MDGNAFPWKRVKNFFRVRNAVPPVDTQRVVEERTEEPQRAPESLGIELMDLEEREEVTFEDLLQHARLKDSFQFYYSSDYEQLYLVLRDLRGASLGIEGPVPLIQLDERKTSQLIATLQKMLAGLREGQIMLGRSREAARLFYPLNLLPGNGQTPLPGCDTTSLDTEPRVTSVRPPFSTEEEEEWDEEDEDDDDLETDDGITYPRWS